jgi:hypothetical protein
LFGGGYRHRTALYKNGGLRPSTPFIRAVLGKYSELKIKKGRLFLTFSGQNKCYLSNIAKKLKNI